MSNVLINQDTMSLIADAIRSKKGETNTYLPAEMPDKILSISGGGGGGDEKACSAIAFYDEFGEPITFTGSFPKDSVFMVKIDTSKAIGDLIYINPDWLKESLSTYIGNNFGLTLFWEGKDDTGTTSMADIPLPFYLRLVADRNVSGYPELNESAIIPKSSLYVNSDGRIYSDQYSPYSVISLWSHDLARYKIFYKENIKDEIFGNFSKVRIEGSDWSVSSNKHIVEYFFHEKGDIFIWYHIDTLSQSYTFNGINKYDGNYTVLTPFDLAEDNHFISLYATNPYGTSYEVDYGMYDISKVSPYRDTVAMTASLEDCMKENNFITYNQSYHDDDSLYILNNTDFSWGNKNISQIGLNGNSLIYLDGSDSISFNGTRDGGDPGMRGGKARIQYITDYNNLKCLHFLWEGSHHYSLSTIDQKWDLLLFENGDAMIYSRMFYDKSNRFRFLGQDYSEYIDGEGDYVSFYLQEDGTYEIKKEIYQLRS